MEHVLVGPEVETYGDTTAAEVIDPTEVPPCDTLLLDCEGSEQAILKNLPSMPDRIVVETHGAYGYPTDETVSIMEDRGMMIDEVIPAHITAQEIAVEKDIMAVSARKSNDG